MAKRWTREEEMALIQGIGVYGIEWFKKKCGKPYNWPNAPAGRSADAIRSKALRLVGSSIRRGTYSLNEIMNKTGYSKTQIRRAMRALGQKWKRLSSTGPYIVYEDQYLDIIAWLAQGYWSISHRRYNCTWCDGTTQPHKGKGLCLTCYRRYISRLRRLELPIENNALREMVKLLIPEGDFVEVEKQLDMKRALPEYLIEPCRECRKLFIGASPICSPCLKRNAS